MGVNGTGTDGGVFSGKSVLATPLAQFLVQAIIVISLSRLLDVFLRFLHQPRVIAEIITGICLGPSVLGRIPGFTRTIFPEDSVPRMALVANIGLVLYMFLVGLEMDPKSFFVGMRKTVIISVAGMIVPFGLGLAIARGMYDQLLQLPDIPFVSFMLFMGVAMSITAFPILGRILSEKRIFGTTVGSMTISAAAFDDATVWCLLALVLSIVNAHDSLTALWVFLTMMAYVIILLVVVRLLMNEFVRRSVRSRRFSTAAMSQGFLAFIFLFIFVSAWITEFIGVNSIFGAFLVGVIVPRGSGIVVSLMEKMEDLVTVVLLPLYFASSGLKTHISVMNEGTAWCWLLAVTVIACTGKIGGCTLAARLSGLTWRESLSIGILMNTKALILLIVLNIGLDAGVINDRIFAVMVIMCLITTFMTSPLITILYPKKYQTTIDEAIRQQKARSKLTDGAEDDEDNEDQLRDTFNVLACVDRVDQVPSLVTLANKFKVPPQQHEINRGGDSVARTEPPLNFAVLRLMESTERSSTLYYASSAHDSSPPPNSDAVLQIMKVFGRLLNITTKCFYAVSPVDAYNEEVERIAAAECSNVLLLTVDADGADDRTVESVLKTRVRGLVPLVYVDRQGGIDDHTVDSNAKAGDPPADAPTAETPLNEPITDGLCAESMKVLIPFVGGRLDRLALKVALRMGQNQNVQVTVLHVTMAQLIEVEMAPLNGTAKKNGAIPLFNGKLRSDTKKVSTNYDADLLSEAKHDAEYRPKSVTIRTVNSTSLADCLIDECKEHNFDLIILSHTIDSSISSAMKSLKKRLSNGSVEMGLPLPDAVPLQPANGDTNHRKSSIVSFNRQKRHGWTWQSTNESIMGVVGYQLFQNTETSLLVVGRSDLEMEARTHV